MGFFSKIFGTKKAIATEELALGNIKIVKATTDDKPTTIPSEYAKAVVKKQVAASKTKPSKDAENKKPVAKKPAAKKPVAKAAPKTQAKPVAKKPAPKKK